MTDIFEGSIIRLARRLDEFLNQVSGSESVEILILAISEKMLKTNYSMLMFSWPVFSLGYVNSYSFLSATFLWLTSFCIFSEVEKFYFFQLMLYRTHLLVAVVKSPCFCALIH